MVKARVFISCGQAKGTEEEQIAAAIADRLYDLGFDPYVAVFEQTLRGLTENIFQQLRKSEYFIFIDFKREKLDVTAPTFRGSLFAHQELGIASFLGLEVLAFQEKGVKHDDGIMRFIQANAISFTDRHTLVNVVADKISQRKWDPRWRNELVLERNPHEFTDAYIEGGKLGRFFHIDVCNLHPNRIATNCYAYLQKVSRIDPPTEFVIRTVEYKWEATRLPNVGIAAGTTRSLDAFFILHDFPTVLQFNALADSSKFFPNVQGEGEYELFYAVISENFAVASASFKLNLRTSIEETTFE
jgi:hypothetical protein